MDPQLKSILSSVLMGVATSAATWASTVGIIPASSQSTIANALVAAVLWCIAAALAWYKTRAHTQSALINAVNAADNGVKVVSAESSDQAVNTPLK